VTFFSIYVTYMYVIIFTVYDKSDIQYIFIIFNCIKNSSNLMILLMSI